jgi:acyl-CoA reductase-like NAD-dependent aldehyde dehydrogenase
MLHGHHVVRSGVKKPDAAVLHTQLQSMAIGSPFGGYKQSGFGREMGKAALELYTQIKSVWVGLGAKD